MAGTCVIFATLAFHICETPPLAAGRGAVLPERAGRNKKRRTAICMAMRLSLSLCRRGLVLLCGNPLLLDAGFLAGKLAQVVELGAAHLTYLVHLDAVDVGRLKGEYTLHTYGA